MKGKLGIEKIFFKKEGKWERLKNFKKSMRTGMTMLIFGRPNTLRGKS
jgi:pyruvate/oxaloacetate carboxyltransferase